MVMHGIVDYIGDKLLAQKCDKFFSNRTVELQSIEGRRLQSKVVAFDSGPKHEIVHKAFRDL